LVELVKSPHLRKKTAHPNQGPCASRTLQLLRDELAAQELAMTPQERLDRALDLSDLCAELAQAGEKVFTR
jgi:hypothetical protein